GGTPCVALSRTARDPGEQENSGGQGHERADDPADHGEPRAAERSARPPVATDADGVDAGASLGQHRAIAADGAVAAGAWPGGRRSAVDAIRAPAVVVVVEHELRGHRASLAPSPSGGPNPWVAPRSGHV